MRDNVIAPNAHLYSREEIEQSLEPIHGDTIIGELDPELVSLYVALANAEQQLSEIEDDIKRRFVEKSMTGAIAVIDGAMDPAELHANMASNGWYSSEAEAVALLKQVANWDRLRATFWYDVRENFNVWNDWLEIRSGFRVVSLGKKYDA